MTAPRSAALTRIAVITRIGADVEPLRTELTDSGWTVIHSPMFALEPVDETALSAAFDEQGPFDRIVITSPRAASVALRALGIDRLGDALCITPGAGTARSLHSAGLNVIHPGHGGTSEDVLDVPLLAENDVRGCRVLILAASGGRSLIGRTLSERGAEVRTLAPFRRTPLPPTDELLGVLGAGCSTVTLVSSPATLARLFDVLPQPLRAVWLSGMLVVSSARLAERARSLGASTIVQAEGAADAAMLAALRHAVGDGSGG